MEFFFQERPSTINILLVFDVDTHSASLLAERFVPSKPQFDMVIVVGPFSRAPLTSKEEVATTEGDIASTLAQLENIVCRVVYLSGESDPPSTLIEQLHLTPNSVNIYARRLDLREGLYISGFTETGENLHEGRMPEDVDRSPDSDDELEGVNVQSSLSTIDVIKDVLVPEGTSDGEASRGSSDVGIFALNYKYTHTLNYFLFHMNDVLTQSGVKICIMPPNTDDASRFPSSLGKLSLIVPKSLREGGNYTTIKIVQGEGGWVPAAVEHFKL